MRSQSGMSILKFLILIVVLMLLFAVTAFVVLQDNGIYEREVKPLIENQSYDTNQVATK